MEDEQLSIKAHEKHDTLRNSNETKEKVEKLKSKKEQLQGEFQMEPFFSSPLENSKSIHHQK